MRHLILCFMLIPILLQAQDDARYLANAVPVENGKVVFSKVFPGKGLSKDQLFTIAVSWANGRFADQTNRVLFTDREKGELAAGGEEYLIFSNTSLALDRTLMSYRVILNMEDNTCTMKINGIRYEYSVSYKQEPEKYTAEEWITDKNALSKGKLIRITGKFRKATIDFVDQTFAEFEQILHKQLPQTAQSQPAPEQKEAVEIKTTIAVPDAIPAATPEGFRISLSANNIPETILKMLPNSHLQLNATEGTSINSEGIVWKGISNMFGKVTASLALPKDSPSYNAIGADETYTISFQEETDDSPWFLIECRKQGELNDGTSKTLLGEVLRAWIE